MSEEKNKYITVAYKLYTKDQDETEEVLVEECNTDHPFQFISGYGSVLPAFEQNLSGKQSGEKFDFVIPCADAYGEFQDELMFDVEKKIFELNGKFDTEHIYEGNIIPLQGEDGSRFLATVIEIKDDAVTIDLNHPRAGQDLHFVGEVVTYREATGEEITALLNMMSGEGGCGGCGGHCGGGCGGGDCEGGCGNGCGGGCCH
ncbi:MAG: FKBP-type peptidyl-prolyl cis-trans isomerase [Bacteroidaceae bacterium]|nr:FKBP-type peptidyl-prolyl cis-trans isomerase [Bacteroidaceae bacterium]